jgi:hypothetical protein
VQISVKADVESVKAQLLYLQNEGVRKAAARALNNTAFAARKDLQAILPQVFDRPTRWTLNAPWVEKARPGRAYRLAATVSLQGKFLPSTRESFLAPHIDSGPRKPKRMEVLLRARGVLGANEYLVPSQFQRLDAYGNVPRSVVQKVLANLQAHFDPHQRTPIGGARSGKKKAEYYFTRKGVRGQRLTAIWQRFPGGHAVPAFIVVSSAPKYRKRLPFAKIVKVAIDRVWPVEFERQVSSEIHHR